MLSIKDEEILKLNQTITKMQEEKLKMVMGMENGPLLKKENVDK